MTDVSPQEFLDILKDPTMSAMKKRVIGFIRNPKTQIMEVSVVENHLGDEEIITLIKIRTRTYD